MNLLHLTVALAEFIVALLLFHQTLAAAFSHGRNCAVRLWLIAMALAMMGAGRFTNFLEGTDGPLVYTFGHVCLISYGVARFLASRRLHGRPRDIYCPARNSALAGG